MNRKLRNILVGVDFGEPSLAAVNVAVSLAKANNAKLHLIHVRDQVLESLRTNGINRDRMADHATNILAAMANDITAKSGISISIIEEEGHTAEVILRNSIHITADLLVIGTYGASGFRKGYIGSNAYTITKHAACPILLIPGGNQPSAFRAPLLPVRPVITALRHYEFFRDLLAPKPSIYILGLYPTPNDGNLYDLQDLTDKMQTTFNHDGVQLKTSVINTASNIPQKVLQTVDELQNDLLIITPVTDVSNKQFFIGPHAHFMLNNARIPMLVMNRRREL